MIIVCTICFAFVVVDVIVNKLNPTPKMQDRNEEKNMVNNIVKTRNMFETIKR